MTRFGHAAVIGARPMRRKAGTPAEFIFYPAVKADIVYDDNIFASPHKTGDWLTYIASDPGKCFPIGNKMRWISPPN